MSKDNSVNMTDIGLMLVHCLKHWPTLNEHCFRVSISRALGRINEWGGGEEVNPATVRRGLQLTTLRRVCV